MHSIVIADDESLIVNGLAEKVDWAAMDGKVVGVATNGLQALQLIESLDPDILITDIVMPGKTGLELAEWIRQHNRRTEVILLSTYDNFEYARDALRIGVCDYILKPIDIDKLKEAANKALDRLDGRPEREQAEEMAAERWQTDLDILFETAQYGLALRDDKRVSGFGTGFVLMFKAYNYRQEDLAGILHTLSTDTMAALDSLSLKHYHRNVDRMIVFLIGTSDLKSIAKVTERSVSLLRMWETSVQALVTAACGTELCALDTLNHQYIQCVCKIDQAYFSDVNCLWEEVVQPSPLMVQDELDEFKTALINAVTRALYHAYNSLLEKLRTQRNASFAEHALREVHRTTTNVASLTGMMNRLVVNQDIQEGSFRYHTQSIQCYWEGVCEYVRQMQDVGGRLRLLMKENYQRASFSLSELAEQMGMSVTYMSRLFKKEIGKNFQDMLVELRIQKARKLLENSSMKQHQIAMQAGFEDERYFGQVFRKHCGMTPGQYRERMKKSQHE